MSFTDKVVLVTGASSGIGAATAIQFAAEGARVAIVGRNESKLKVVSEKCEQNGSKPLVIVADVSKDSDAKRIVSDAINHFGKMDVLVNNAGIGRITSIEAENAMSVFDKVMNTNLRSAIYITNLAAPHLVETKGNIINISSIAALRVLPIAGFAYSTSKAALDHFTRCIALEFAPKGVRANTVNPGPVQTDIFEYLGEPEAQQRLVWERIQKGTALNRIADPEEVADLVLFLASDKAKSITGSTYVTDNGAVLKGNMVR